MRLSPLAVAAALAGWSGAAFAVDCASPSGVSPCVDANALWLTADRSRFVVVPSADPLGRESVVVGVASTFLWQPIVFEVRDAPAPGGREVRAVDWTLDLTLLAGFGVTDRVSLFVEAPVAIEQQGAGPDALTAQDPPTLAETAARDPRLGASFALVRGSAFALASSLTLALPLGDPNGFATSDGFALAPAFVAGGALSRFHYGIFAGARLSEAVSFGTERVGSALDLRLGLGVDVLADGLLSVTGEGFALPSLLEQAQPLPFGGEVTRGLSVPAEWLASLRSEPTEGLLLQLGAGAALPLSSVTFSPSAGAAPTTDDGFSAAPSARLRVFLSVRVASD